MLPDYLTLWSQIIQILVPVAWDRMVGQGLLLLFASGKVFSKFYTGSIIIPVQSCCTPVPDNWSLDKVLVSVVETGRLAWASFSFLPLAHTHTGALISALFPTSALFCSALLYLASFLICFTLFVFKNVLISALFPTSALLSSVLPLFCFALYYSFLSYSLVENLYTTQVFPVLLYYFLFYIVLISALPATSPFCQTTTQ